MRNFQIGSVLADRALADEVRRWTGSDVDSPAPMRRPLRYSS